MPHIACGIGGPRARNRRCDRLVGVTEGLPSSAGLLTRFREQLKDGETSDRSFGLTLGGVIALLGLVPLLKHKPVQPFWLGAGFVLFALGLAAPTILHRAKRAWLFLGFLMGIVVNPIVLGILFLVAFTPAGWIMRLTGHDPLRLRLDRGASTYWLPRTGQSDMEEEF